MKIIIPITDIKNQSTKANEQIKIIFEPKIKRIDLRRYTKNSMIDLSEMGNPLILIRSLNLIK